MSTTFARRLQGGLQSAHPNPSVWRGMPKLPSERIVSFGKIKQKTLTLRAKQVRTLSRAARTNDLPIHTVGFPLHNGRLTLCKLLGGHICQGCNSSIPIRD